MNALYHYGTPRHSGRYPWGSGKNPQRNRTFLQRAEELKKQGLSDTEIAKAFNMSTGQYRALRSIASNEKKKEDIRRVQTLYDRGYSKMAISRETGLPESTVRNYLNPTFQARRDKASLLADKLKEQVEDRRYLDVGEGVELQLGGVSPEQMQVALEILKQEGYTVHNLQVTQASDVTRKTTVKVLTKDDVSFNEVRENRDKISSPEGMKFEDYGKVVREFNAPQSISSDRILIRYSEDGGKEKDGTIELREGVSDLDLGGGRYAQVRIAVDGTHYLKGMAIYNDGSNMPDGVDIIFNTNKSKDIPKMDVLKPMKTDKNGNVDLENPFGASIKDQKGALNIVNEDEDWEKWSKNLSSQFLSKQSTDLAARQLNLAYEEKANEFKDICELTNPVVKSKLLESFADNCDSAAVHLKAAALPRQATHVILPVTSLKDNEVYAPNYENGEELALVRFPHGSIVEIPKLKVNNNNPEAKALLGNAKTAIGINSNVAQQLSGADFDGDTVVCIPLKNQKIKTVENVKLGSPLRDLKNFDPSERYPSNTSKDINLKGFHKQQEMGKVSNLITDMTLRGADDAEIARAIRHSMVVIDAEKHNLDWRASAADNGIAELKAKYQGGSNRGASTLISKASSDEYVMDRKELKRLDAMTPEQKKRYLEGKVVYTDSGKQKRTKDGSYQLVKTKSTKMAERDNAYDLSSGTIMEDIYADHANKMKALANSARKELRFNTGKIKFNSSAKEAYKEERASLIAKLNIARKNAPLERQAQLIASVKSAERIRANDVTDKDDKKKIRSQEINKARSILGTRSRNPKNPNSSAIKISDREWAAIQSGAISESMLRQIIKYTDLDELKERSMPREKSAMPSSSVRRAKILLKNGYTQAEVAKELGVSVSTLSKELKDI